MENIIVYSIWHFSSSEETHHFYQNKILKIKKRKINLTLSIEM
jgi:hypothetical protein